MTFSSLRGFEKHGSSSVVTETFSSTSEVVLASVEKTNIWVKKADGYGIVFYLAAQIPLFRSRVWRRMASLMFWGFFIADKTTKKNQKAQELVATE